MRRPLLLAALLLALGAAPAHAATGEYSTGTINVRIPAGGTLERAIAVPHRGPVSFVRVAFRIAHPRTADLTVSLVSPRGTEVPLVVRRGGGADFGAEKRGCGGTVTVLDSDMDSNPVAESDSPFTDNPYMAEGKLGRLYREEAHGRWTLRISNAGEAAGALHCFELDLGRDVPETITKSKGAVRATVTFTERNFLYKGLRLEVVRRGKTVVDSPLEKLNCRDCGTFRPTAVKLVDLDGGEPEVIVEMFSGGAHCCVFTLVLGWDARRARYSSRLGYWGNYGYRLVDLDGDGLPELSAYDERFVYTFTAYVFSTAPIQIWRYELHRFSDVTDEFPREVEKDAARLLRTYEKARKEADVDVRAFVAAYVADLYRIGRAPEADRFLQTALKRGDLGGKDQRVWPAGTVFIAELKRLLRGWGYISP